MRCGLLFRLATQRCDGRTVVLASDDELQVCYGNIIREIEGTGTEASNGKALPIKNTATAERAEDVDDLKIPFNTLAELRDWKRGLAHNRSYSCA